MQPRTAADRKSLGALSGAALEQYQLTRLNRLLDTILPQNTFYAAKLAGVARPLESLDALAQIPFTFKQELFHERHPDDLARNHTWPLDRYVRLHQTSGTRGRPLAVLDTAADWQWWLDTWQFVYDAAGVQPGERVLAAFSFGPYVGFWSGFEAAAARGCQVLAGGGMNTLARLELARSRRATVLLATPSYALHMAEVGLEHQVDVADLGIRRILLAGEPGGSVPAIRQRIADSWQAEVFDHAGSTEAGPWGMPAGAGRGLQVIESEFIPEFLSLETGGAANEGELAELVITSLGRPGCPLLRYRTGDLVRPRWGHDLPCRFVALDGGIVGRADDMLVIRGVNVFPSALDQLVRSFPEVIEYRATAIKQGEMDQLVIEIEDRLRQPDRVSQELQLRLGLKVSVCLVEVGSLPRFEGKGKRLIDRRGHTAAP